MKNLFLAILLLPSFFFANLTIKDQLVKAHVGDYIVTEQGSNYAIILLRSVDKDHATIEEITVEKKNIDLKKINWKEWIESKAPGASSWNAFALHLEKNELGRAYSFLDNQWLVIDNADYFFKELLTMPFQPTRDIERKKVGPAPMPGEMDRRRFWKPQLIFEGKQEKNPEYEVLRAKWKSDKSQLAGCIFELYLDLNKREFAFPYWLEVQHPHFTFKIRAIDSGRGIQSPTLLLK